MISLFVYLPFCFLGESLSDFSPFGKPQSTKLGDVAVGFLNNNEEFNTKL